MQMEDKIGASPSEPTLGVFIRVRTCRGEASRVLYLYMTWCWATKHAPAFILHKTTEEAHDWSEAVS